MRRAAALVLVAALAALLVPAVAGAAKKDSAKKSASASAKQKGGGGASPRIQADAWLLIDPRDDAVLAAKRPDARLAIASTTKLMTAYLVLENLAPKRKLTAVPYKALAAESLLGLQAGERMTVRDLLYALMLPSANDAAATLATGVSGSEAAFVAEMNESAAELGLDNTSFANPIGLDAPGNYSSAADLAELTEIDLRDPLFKKIVDTPSARLTSGNRPRKIDSRNLLLNKAGFVTGVKTGHTIKAGYVLVGSAERSGTTLISVVLGAPSEAARDTATLKLLDYGFSQYKSSTPVDQGEELADPKLDYRSERLALVAERKLPISVRTGQRVATRVDAPEEVKGPVDEGEKLGQVVVTVDGKRAASSPLVAAESAPAASLLQKATSTARSPLLLFPAGAFVIVVGLLLARRGRHPEGKEPPKRKRSENGDRTPEERRKMHEERMRRRSDRTGAGGGRR